MRNCFGLALLAFSRSASAAAHRCERGRRNVAAPFVRTRAFLVGVKKPNPVVEIYRLSQRYERNAALGVKVGTADNITSSKPCFCRFQSFDKDGHAEARATADRRSSQSTNHTKAHRPNARQIDANARDLQICSHNASPRSRAPWENTKIYWPTNNFPVAAKLPRGAATNRRDRHRQNENSGASLSDTQPPGTSFHHSHPVCDYGQMRCLQARRHLPTPNAGLAIAQRTNLRSAHASCRQQCWQQLFVALCSFLSTPSLARFAVLVTAIRLFHVLPRPVERLGLEEVDGPVDRVGSRRLLLGRPWALRRTAGLGVQV